ncbi:ankyrin repeat domain-containing protein 54-like [Lingula anatina]|uniref:Ankyrin repeat domain-containing protein 54-like n=1 Tax=Lingula anatina TaxID=7574 RepID=A0A1S3HZ23_LINAN|nr:ankyrin repeat domain-containing protein 54-like [Lingula anatina]|eukprot:XP_013391272.1 ankyrin repeat domain-containing protein 54-like [Lingula anatina]
MMNMEERDSGHESCVSSSSDDSMSDGDYVVQQPAAVSPALSEEQPKFDFTSWSPDAPAGLQWLSLLPMGADYGSQKEHVGRIRVSATHRKARMKRFASGQTVAKNKLDERRLRNAVNDNDYYAAFQLLDGGVDPCNSDEKKRSPLHFAACKGNERIASLLLDYGADPNQRDVLGNTALHLAACTNNIKMVTVLLSAGRWH